MSGGADEELLEFLDEQISLREEDAPTLLARIVKIRQAKEDWSGAALTLRRVAEPLRNDSWGKSACEVGEACGDDQLRVAGMMVREHCATTDETRAEWLRDRARILWWNMGEFEQAQEILEKLFSPLNPKHVNSRFSFRFQHRYLSIS